MENIGTITKNVKKYFQSLAMLARYSLIMRISKNI